MKIIITKQEIEYRGIYFTFRTVKKELLNLIPKVVFTNDFKEYCIHKTFNTKTGEIERKYAWDSIFQSLHEKGLLATVLDSIIDKEYLS